MKMLKQRWNALSPKKRKLAMYAGGIASLILLSVMVSSMSPSQKAVKKVNDDVEVDVFLPKRRDATLEELNSSIMAQDRKMSRMDSSMKQNQRMMTSALADIKSEFNSGGQDKGKVQLEGEIDYLSQRIRVLESKFARSIKELSESSQLAQRQLKTSMDQDRDTTVSIQLPDLSQGLDFDIPQKKTVQLPGDNETRSFIETPTLQGVEDDDIDDIAPEARSPMRIVSASTMVPDEVVDESDPVKKRKVGKKKKDQTKRVMAKGQEKPGTRSGGISQRERTEQKREAEKSQGVDVYLPSGSMFSGVFLNGIDAPTRTSARNNPSPVLIRVKMDAILPNYYSLNIRECFILASGYGDMGSERALMRTERISCVRSDGEVIDTSLDGYLIGDDGKAGIRGRLVTKQGTLMARSVTAGVLSGFSDALAPQGVTGVNLNPSGSLDTQQADINTVFQSGAYKGASEAASKVADFYFDLAEQTMPIIEIDAGREVTIVVTKGMPLKLG